MRMRFRVSLLMGPCPALSTFVEGFGRVALYLRYFMFLSPKSCLLKFVTVVKLKASCSLEQVAFNLKISQYADDATLILKSEKSLFKVLSVVSRFELGSGAKLNTSKSEAMWLGRWHDRGDSPYGLKWVTKIRILGVFSRAVSSQLTTIISLRNSTTARLLASGNRGIYLLLTVP